MSLSLPEVVGEQAAAGLRGDAGHLIIVSSKMLYGSLDHSK